MSHPASFTPATGDFRSLLWAGYGSITLSFGVFGIWAACAPLDSAAIVPAQVAVVSSKKPIQHKEGGLLLESLVGEAQRVEAGQILFRLQPIQAHASAETLRSQVDGALALEARLAAERDSAAVISWPPELAARRFEPEMVRTMADLDRQLSERQRSLEAQIGVQNARIQQSLRDIDGKRSSEDALVRRVASLSADLARVTPLADRGYFLRSKLNTMQRDVWQAEGELGVVRGDIARAKEVITEARQQITVLRQGRIDEAAQQLADVHGKLKELRERQAVAADVVARLDVRAPRAGIVQGIKVHTVGEVVHPGDTLAELVTPEEGLIMTGQVAPDDIDAVRAGARAEIRFPAFASRQRSATRGRVDTVASDLTVDPNGKQGYYLARIVIDTATLPPDLIGHLVPGMPASVMISTGERTMLNYLVGPMYDRVVRTMRER